LGSKNRRSGATFGGKPLENNEHGFRKAVVPETGVLAQWPSLGYIAFWGVKNIVVASEVKRLR